MKEKEHIFNKNNKKLKVSCEIINQDNHIFKVYYTPFDSQYSSIDSVSITFKNYTQTINLAKNEMTFYSTVIEAFPINSFIDYNFDGYNDINIHHNGSWSKNPNHFNRDYYYLFDKVNNKYLESMQLDAIDITNVCKKDKCLHSVIYDFSEQPTSLYKSADYSNCNYSKLTKYIWVKDYLKATEIIEEKKIRNSKYSIKKTNLIDKRKQEYLSQISIINNMNCE